jgi:hemerythrin-like metal-binding protein
MMLWNPTFATGNHVVDEQHRKLFQRVYELQKAMQRQDADAVKEMLRALTAVSVYVEVHFTMEEGLMRAAGYPDLPRHLEQHTYLRSHVEGLVDRYKKKDLRPGELLDFLERWLARHVQEDDKVMAGYLRQGQPREATA